MWLLFLRYSEKSITPRWLSRSSSYVQMQLFAINSSQTRLQTTYLYAKIAVNDIEANQESHYHNGFVAHHQSIGLKILRQFVIPVIDEDLEVVSQLLLH